MLEIYFPEHPVHAEYAEQTSTAYGLIGLALNLHFADEIPVDNNSSFNSESSGYSSLDEKDAKTKLLSLQAQVPVGSLAYGIKTEVPDEGSEV